MAYHGLEVVDVGGIDRSQRISVSQRRDFHRSFKSRALFPVLAILGLLTVPVECTLVHGAHSIFTPPAAIAAQTNAPQPPGSIDHRSESGPLHGASHPSTISERHNQIDSMPIPPSSQHRVRTETIPVLRSYLMGSTVDGAAWQGPRALPMTAMASAPGLPAVLNSFDPILPLLPSAVRPWLGPARPHQQRLPGPESPPP